MEQHIRSCSLEECERVWYSLDWCKKHYERVRKHGSPEPRKGHHESNEVKFSLRVGEPDANGCIPWIDTLDDDGYGTFTINRRPYRAHRFAYERVHGPIPAELVVDHQCEVRHCVNPEHMKITTRGFNTLRSETGITARNKRKTHCPQKHEYTPENTRTSRGKRYCRECDYIRYHGKPRSQ